jgi:hypothetical protein
LSSFRDGPPDSSNFYCLPGKAGGSPFVLDTRAANSSSPTSREALSPTSGRVSLCAAPYSGTPSGKAFSHRHLRAYGVKNAVASGLLARRPNRSRHRDLPSPESYRRLTKARTSVRKKAPRPLLYNTRKRSQFFIHRIMRSTWRRTIERIVCSSGRQLC